MSKLITDTIANLMQNNKELKLSISEMNNVLSRLNGAIRADIDKQLEEAYQRGLEDGKNSVSHECDGCLYNDGTKEHSLCHICSNAYINRWTAKPKADDEIKVGDEVEVLNSRNKYLIAWISTTSICGFAHDGVNCCLRPSDVRKTGRHFDIESILEEMKHED